MMLLSLSGVHWLVVYSGADWLSLSAIPNQNAEKSRQFLTPLEAVGSSGSVM